MSLDLGLIGNGTVGALVAPRGEIVWACFPRFDGDPTFCSLLRPRTGAEGFGYFDVELLDLARDEQAYLVNSPILVTRLHDRSGGGIEITDFAPRFRQSDRIFCPMMLVRRIKRIAGNPRLRLRMRPARHYGESPAEITRGSDHIRYAGGEVALRLTTDAPLTAIVDEDPFLLEDAVTLLLGPDETVTRPVAEVGDHFLAETADFWRQWVRALGTPFEWQEAVIRAAIVLRLNVFEPTGAIIAAMTTSIPESPGSVRNWDYRFCWLRDAGFVIDALNRLGATGTMERYLGYLLELIAGAGEGPLHPVYGIDGHAVPDEREIETLPGYRGMGPVRAGNQAYAQVQHDVYGAAILSATHAFFDRRLVRPGDAGLFRRLEALGERAAVSFDQPDAGLWERRGVARVHTYSSVMCWAGCDRLARIAAHLGLADRSAHWRAQAARIQQVICERSWNPERGSFVATMGGEALDASLLRLNELGFLANDDPRFAGTVRAIERGLRRGDFIFRYVEEDDFGKPQNAFLVCTFWYIEALAALGRRDEARALFEHLLACRNRHGLLAEDIDPATREPWGNFPQTYSMAGLIAAAMRLSVGWDQAS